MSGPDVYFVSHFTSLFATEDIMLRLCSISTPSSLPYIFDERCQLPVGYIPRENVLFHNILSDVS